MERNRLWHDPVVEIFSNLITPGVCCSANAYDLANRRWYRLDVNSEVGDDDWLSSTVARHIKEFYAANREVPPWNTIKTTTEGRPVTFETSPDDGVDRPIRQSLSYGHESTDKLRTTTFDELESLNYISRSADRCTWKGKDCVFKRIEFDVDIRVITEEIRSREALIDAIGAGGNTNVDDEMTRRFQLVPVLAVVIGNSKPWQPGTVAGVLMPYVGNDLELLARDNNDGLPITEGQLRELVRGVQQLGKCGIQHGDIKYWNTTIQPAGNVDDAARLVLIDIGSVAPDYDGDAKALGVLLLWCLEHAPTLRANKDVRS